MVRITKKVDYSILILCHLAQNPHKACSAREISDRFAIPRPVVANLLKALCKNDLLRSQRGNRGGYWLLHSPGDLTLAQLLQAVEGDFAFANCTYGGPLGEISACPRSGQCPSEDALRYVHQEIHKILNSVTIEQLAGDSVPAESFSASRPARGPANRSFQSPAV